MMIDILKKFTTNPQLFDIIISSTTNKGKNKMNNKIKFCLKASKIIKNRNILKQYLDKSFTENKDSLPNEMTEYLHNHGMPDTIKVIEAFPTMLIDTMSKNLDCVIEGPEEDIKNYIPNYLNIGSIELN